MSDVITYCGINNNLIDSIARCANDKKYKKVFFLIDAMAGPVPIGYWQSEAGEECCWDISDSKNQDNSPLQLLCFDLDRLDVISHIIAAAEDDKCRNAVCSWLFSRKNGDDIQRHLSNILLLRYESEDWLFRYYDPRVMSRLISILSLEQMDDLLGIIDSWHFLNRYKKEAVIEHTAKISVGDGLIKLNRIQWKQVVNIEWFNRTVDAYSRYNPTPLNIVQEKLLDDALIYVDRFNIVRGEDILAFSQFSLIYGKGVLSNGEVRKMVLKSIEERMPLIDFFSKKTDEFWMTV